jgi:hypothetical protein
MKLTRRTVLAAALPALAAAQTPPVPATPATPVAPDYLAISAAQYKRNADALAKVAVPMETEPAFHFKP